MGDGPNTTAGEGERKYRQVPESPWPQDEPMSVPRRYGQYGEPNNPLDARHEPLYPGERPRIVLPQVPDAPSQQGLDVSEQFDNPGPVFNKFDQPISTPSTLRGEFPTAAQVHAESGRYWNNNIDTAQFAWNAYKLYPYPKMPPMFPVTPVFPLKNNGLIANFNNLASWSPALAGGAFLTEIGIDKVTGLDKNEFQTARIVADILGPRIILSKAPMLNTWWSKGLSLVASHTLGRLIDKFTETPMKKWLRTGDA